MTFLVGPGSWKFSNFFDVIKTYQNYLIRCRMPNYASWPNLAWKSPLLVLFLLLCQNDLKQWKIDIFGGSGVMKILKFLDVIKTYQNYLIRCRMPNYASWPNFAWKSPLLVPLLLLSQNDLKQWKIDIFGGSRVMKILKFLDVIKTYQNYLIRCRMPNYASWPNFAWKSPLLVPLLLLCQNDLKQWKIDIFGGSRVMKILKFLDVIKTYQNYLIRCRMPNYASWPNLAWKSPLLVLFLLLCINDLKQWKIDIFGGSRVMKILKFLDVIKTYQKYLTRCGMPNYASWPNLAWKSPLLVLFFATLSKWPKSVKNWHFWWVRVHQNSQISWYHKNLPKQSYSMQHAKLCILAEFGVNISIIIASFATLSKWPKRVKNWHFWWVPGH